MTLSPPYPALDEPHEDQQMRELFGRIDGIQQVIGPATTTDVRSRTRRQVITHKNEVTSLDSVFLQPIFDFSIECSASTIWTIPPGGTVENTPGANVKEFGFWLINQPIQILSVSIQVTEDFVRFVGPFDDGRLWTIVYYLSCSIVPLPSTPIWPPQVVSGPGDADAAGNLFTWSPGLGFADMREGVTIDLPALWPHAPSHAPDNGLFRSVSGGGIVLGFYAAWWLGPWKDATSWAEWESGKVKVTFRFALLGPPRIDEDNQPDFITGLTLGCPYDPVVPCVVWGPEDTYEPGGVNGRQ